MRGETEKQRGRGGVGGDVCRERGGWIEGLKDGERGLKEGKDR